MLKALRAPLVAAMAAIWFPAPAAAILMPDLDLTSLAYLAETIVLVQEPPYQTVDWIQRGQGTVLESFKGSFKAGEFIQLAIPGGYSRRLYLGMPEELPRGLALMFLVPAEKAPGHWPVPSGIKLIVNDAVFGFQQQGNPGPYAPRPMQAELIALPDGAPYDRAALLQDLAAALARAARFHTALEARDLNVLAEFVRRRDQPAPIARQRDELSRLAAKALGEHGDLDFILSLLAARYGQIHAPEFDALTEPFRTAAGFEFLLEKSAVLRKGAAAETVRELLAGMRQDPKLRGELRFTPKTLSEKAALVARRDHLRKLASARTTGAALTPADLDALIFTREPALAPTVLRHAQSKLGPQLERHAGDPETLRRVAEYFARVPHPPAWVVFARALCRMRDTEPDVEAARRLAAALAATCPRDEAEPLEILLNGMAVDDPPRFGAPAGLRAIGGDRAIAQIVQRLEAQPPRLPRQAIFIIGDLDPTGRPATVATLIRLITDRNFAQRRAAMEIAEKYVAPALDAALLDTARDPQTRMHIRADAIEALGKRGTRAAREIVETLGRAESGLRQAAAAALGRFGDRASLPLLASWLEERATVSTHAARSIGLLTGQNFPATDSGVEAARAWWKSQAPPP